MMNKGLSSKTGRKVLAYLLQRIHYMLAVYQNMWIRIASIGFVADTYLKRVWYPFSEFDIFTIHKRFGLCVDFLFISKNISWVYRHAINIPVIARIAKKVWQKVVFKI
jgi:hypothetical protein